MHCTKERISCAGTRRDIVVNAQFLDLRNLIYDVLVSYYKVVAIGSMYASVSVLIAPTCGIRNFAGTWLKKPPTP